MSDLPTEGHDPRALFPSDFNVGGVPNSGGVGGTPHSDLPEGPRVGEVIIRYKTGGEDISNLPTGGGGSSGDPVRVSTDGKTHYYTLAEAESGALSYFGSDGEGHYYQNDENVKFYYRVGAGGGQAASYGYTSGRAKTWVINSLVMGAFTGILVIILRAVVNYVI